MKKFFSEFKKFITRGNVIDMAVGVIVGSSFTAIVNGMSNFILKPIINWLLALILGADSLSKVYTFLKPVYDAEGVIDLKQSIYIDWGSFINAVINFFLVALVLFSIVKIVNKFREGHKNLTNSINDSINSGKPSKEDKAAMKKLGIKFSDSAAVSAYYADKAKKAEEAKKAAEEKARQDRLANPTTEDLLKEIRDLLKKD